jgi:GrpB-like predicted nucleotidyltransferase (UPF0157 family)
VDSESDILISTFAFHHLNILEKEKAINLLLDYLKPGGKIIIADLMFLSVMIIKIRGDNMKTQKVIVVPYDENWVSGFVKIKNELLDVLDHNVISIEHVGSTSVKGLSAKPIIDIDVIIDSYDVFNVVSEELENVGYYHEGDLGIKDREAFGYQGKTHLMLHHLYVCPKYSEELKRHIAFRDHLRENEEDKITYASLKLQLAKQFPMDIDSYIEGKSLCVQNILSKCDL